MAEAPLVCTKTNLIFRLEAKALEGQASGTQGRHGRDSRRPREAARAVAGPGRAGEREDEQARGGLEARLGPRGRSEAGPRGAGEAGLESLAWSREGL